ncbi:hypothetical protein [Nesterenkonia alkaliphila]|uniref:hypothetical protein n=1 Tax=Nesterenkonia alkaliphila TaxID=1463631 RepID=UPI0019ADD299|nr:hypothetical protein [Nesterenkonia alkaliphila]GFZ85373.1 hypothetical protein GCM10011359_13110 [Nesterenkonia alkaliphila]
MGRATLGRTGSPAYRGYLRSQAWGWRRQRWFQDRRAEGKEPACQVCGLTLTEHEAATGRGLDLHHTSYGGVTQDAGGRWRAEEKDQDLMPMCRYHHQALHRVMDRPKDHNGWNRRRATVVILRDLIRRHQRLTPAQRAQLKTAILASAKHEHHQYTKG